MNARCAMPCIHHILQQHQHVQHGSHIHLFLVNWKYLVSNIHSLSKVVNLYEIPGKKESLPIVLILGSDSSFCLFHKIAGSDVLNILRHQVLKERDVGW